MSEPMLLLHDFDFHLRTESGHCPAVEISMSAVVTSLMTDIDAAELSAFKEKVRAFVESELPKHIKIREAAR